MPWAVRGTVYGVLWSVSITASEMLVIPFGRVMPDQLLWIGQIFGSWLVSGIAIGCVVVVLEPQLDRTWKIALLVGVVSLVSAVLAQAEWVLLHVLFLDSRLAGPSWSNFLYNVWMALFHGGIFVVGCVVMTRADRGRHVLAAAQIARDRNEMALDRARLDALGGQIDPDFLLRAVAAIQRHYAAQSGQADLLLDRLVSFLRDAMPGVRSGRSTLAAELSLAKVYAELRAALRPEESGWQVEVHGTLAPMPFPPLLLLPLMDQLGASIGNATLPRRLVVRSGDEGICMAFDVPPGSHLALTEALDYRLRVALRATFGDRFRLSTPGAGGADRLAAVTMHLDAPPAAPPIGPPHGPSALAWQGPASVRSLTFLGVPP